MASVRDGIQGVSVVGSRPSLSFSLGVFEILRRVLRDHWAAFVGAAFFAFPQFSFTHLTKQLYSVRRTFATSASSTSSIKAGSKGSPRARKPSIAPCRSGTLRFWLNLNLPTMRSIAIEKTTIWFVICFRNSQDNSE